MILRNFALIMFSTAAALSPALNVTVAPSTGVGGTAVTNTIADAITQINAGADIGNQITLRSTEGPHILPEDTTWTFAAGKNVAFFSESGQAVVVLQHNTTRYMLTIAAGTDAPNQPEFVTINQITFIPETGLTYSSNTADGINLDAGGYEFNDCIFTSNDGSNGPASLEGDLPYSTTGNNVGDDWIQMDSQNILILNNCTVTGAHDDAVLIGGATAPDVATLSINNGTCLANNGGAGIQIYEDRAALIINGSSNRVLIADNGKRAPNDVGIKFFGDEGCSVDINGADIINNTHSGFFDFSGVPTISIANSRFAFNNSTDQSLGSHFSVWEADTTPDSGGTNQIINFTNVTMHNVTSTAVPDGIFANETADTPRQTFTIKDCIFSGDSDSYANMTNSIASGGPSPAPAVTFSAVVTAGAHALGNAGELAPGQVNADPGYVSLTYTIGRGQNNPDFLLPSDAAYATASSAGGLLRGGAPEPLSKVSDYVLY